MSEAEDLEHGPDLRGNESPGELRRREGALERAFDVRNPALRLMDLDVHGARAQ